MHQKTLGRGAARHKYGDLRTTAHRGDPKELNYDEGAFTNAGPAYGRTARRS